MNIESQIIKYTDLPFDYTKDDPHGIAALCNSHIQNIFRGNPNLKEPDQTFAYFKKVDNKYGGIAMFFPSVMKAGDELLEATGGSTLEVYEEYRQLALGADIVMYPIENKLSNALIYAGISPMALPLYKKTRFAILEYPRLMLLRKSKPILESKNIRGVIGSILSTIIDSLLKVYSLYEKRCRNKLKKQFEIEEVHSIPEIVEEINKSDAHKYAEFHSKEWFQWNLENNLTGDKKDHQHFYMVSTGGENIGYFMTKERFKKEVGGQLHNIVVGSVVEWGSTDENILSEEKINILALSTFTKDTDIIEFASADNKTISKMKRFGFIQHGFAHIVVKDLTKRFKDIKDIKNWRIRYGYSDVILT